MEKSVKWGNKEVYIHHIAHGGYALVSYTPKKIKLFKLSFEELGMKDYQLEAYLLGQVEKRMHWR
jgi:hypothetical protein